MNNKLLLLNLLLGIFTLLPTAALADEIPVAEFSDDGKTMTFTYADESRVGENVLRYSEKNSWKKEGCDTTVTKVVFDASFSKVKPTNLAGWFAGFKKLTSVEGIQNLNTSEVTDMQYMFLDCPSLTNLDLSNLKNDKLECVRGMFEGCYSLKTINFYDNITGTNRGVLMTKKPYRYSKELDMTLLIPLYAITFDKCSE